MNFSPFIDVQQVSYSYRTERKGDITVSSVLHGVSLQVEVGEYAALLGHNGSGKSTLARLCNALLLPDSGRVLVAGIDTHDELKRRTVRENVGMIFQHPDNQIIATTVEDDVAWALAVRGLPIALIRERVESILQAVGLIELRHAAPHKLSGGQKQRLAIAGVLALRPRCIIADEVTAMLDPLSRQEIVQLLHELNREYGITIIHVTHFLDEVALAQRIIVMERGQIVREASPAALFADIEQLRRLNLAIPEPIELASNLRKAGLRISAAAVTVEAIAQELLA